MTLVWRDEGSIFVKEPLWLEIFGVLPDVWIMMKGPHVGENSGVLGNKISLECSIHRGLARHHEGEMRRKTLRLGDGCFQEMQAFLVLELWQTIWSDYSLQLFVQCPLDLWIVDKIQQSL